MTSFRCLFLLALNRFQDLVFSFLNPNKQTLHEYWRQKTIIVIQFTSTQPKHFPMEQNIKKRKELPFSNFTIFALFCWTWLFIFWRVFRNGWMSVELVCLVKKQLFLISFTIFFVGDILITRDRVIISHYNARRQFLKFKQGNFYSVKISRVPKCL